MIIAIDGPAASGKGTLGKRLAAHYGLAHLDTGLIYRAVAKAVIDAGKQPDDAAAAVAAAKALVNRAARLVGTEAVQLHGGMGLAAEYPAGRYFQRLTVLETLFGDTDAMLAVVEAA